MPAAPAPLLSVRNLAVRYGDLVGLADVSLEVPAGAIVALLGSNGAGKTTTLNAIAGLVPAAGGQVAWSGQDITNRPAYAVVANGLALAPEGWRLFMRQSVEQNLRLGASVLRERAASPPCWSGSMRVPPAFGTAAAARGHAVGRRTADAGDRPRADERSEAADAG